MRQGTSCSRSNAPIGERPSPERCSTTPAPDPPAGWPYCWNAGWRISSRGFGDGSEPGTGLLRSATAGESRDSWGASASTVEARRDRCRSSISRPTPGRKRSGEPSHAGHRDAGSSRLSGGATGSAGSDQGSAEECGGSEQCPMAVSDRLTRGDLPLECGSGGLTAFNRRQRHLPKRHGIDAACVGTSAPPDLQIAGIRPLMVRATGHGTWQTCCVNQHGFPCSQPKGAKTVRDDTTEVWCWRCPHRLETRHVCRTRSGACQWLI